MCLVDDFQGEKPSECPPYLPGSQRRGWSFLPGRCKPWHPQCSDRNEDYRDTRRFFLNAGDFLSLFENIRLIPWVLDVLAFYTDGCMTACLLPNLMYLDLEARHPTSDTPSLNQSLQVTWQGLTAGDSRRYLCATACIRIRDLTFGQIRWHFYSANILTHLPSPVDFTSTEVCFSFHVCSGRRDTSRKKSYQTAC